jgi:hypothetical protein
MGMFGEVTLRSVRSMYCMSGDRLGCDKNMYSLVLILCAERNKKCLTTVLMLAYAVSVKVGGNHVDAMLRQAFCMLNADSLFSPSHLR